MGRLGKLLKEPELWFEEAGKGLFPFSNFPEKHHPPTYNGSSGSSVAGVYFCPSSPGPSPVTVHHLRPKGSVPQMPGNAPGESQAPKFEGIHEA